MRDDPALLLDMLPAAAKISPACRDSHPALPWRAMVGLRHRMTRGYGDVRLEIVWAVLRQRLPE